MSDSCDSMDFRNGGAQAQSSKNLFTVTFVCVMSLQSCLTLCDPMDYIAHQAPLSMGFSRQEYRSGLPFPSPGDLPHPGIKPTLPAAPALQADSLPLRHQGSPTLLNEGQAIESNVSDFQAHVS